MDGVTNGVTTGLRNEYKGGVEKKMWRSVISIEEMEARCGPCHWKRPILGEPIEEDDDEDCWFCGYHYNRFCDTIVDCELRPYIPPVRRVTEKQKRLDAYIGGED